MEDIAGKYRQLGGSRGILGQAENDERTCQDGIGRYRCFEGGCIYWRPDTGAVVIRGPILDRWTALGRENGYLGYPLAELAQTPDGGGLYGRFQGGTIFWFRETGPHDVRGQVRWNRVSARFTYFLQNMALLPSTILQTPLGEIGPLYKGIERDAAVDALTGFLLTERPDLVGLCEIWEKEQSECLVQRLAQTYPHHATAARPGGDMLLDGGLLLLSRFPITAHHSTSFRGCLGEDCYAKKGALHARIHVNDHPPQFDLFLTHTQNPSPIVASPNRGSGLTGRDKVRGQLKHLSDFIEAHRDPENPALLMGDLNTDALQADDYEDMMARLGRPDDLWIGSNKKGWSKLGSRSLEFETPDGLTADRSNTFSLEETPGPAEATRHKNGGRIDYLLSYRGSRYWPSYRNTRIIALQSTPGRDMSDHYGLATELSDLYELILEPQPFDLSL